MATPGALVTETARLLGMSEVYLSAYDRALAKAGLRASGGRGPSAARMGSDDAAALLISVLSGGLAKDAAESVQVYSALKPELQVRSIWQERRLISFVDYRSAVDTIGFNLSAIENLPVNHSFFEIFSALLLAATTGEIEESVKELTASVAEDVILSEVKWHMRVRLYSPMPKAEIIFAYAGVKARYIYGVPDNMSQLGDLQREFSITQETILGIGQLLRT